MHRRLLQAASLTKDEANQKAKMPATKASESRQGARSLTKDDANQKARTPATKRLRVATALVADEAGMPGSLLLQTNFENVCPLQERVNTLYVTCNSNMQDRDHQEIGYTLIQTMRWVLSLFRRGHCCRKGASID